MIAGWQLIIEPDGRSGAENMAVDCALLAAAREGAAFVRLYRWRPGCLSFGRHEPALRRYDRARIEALGLTAVRRPTGGRAVWHDAEVTYAVAAPAAVFGSVRDAYISIHRVVAEALRALGAPVALAGRASGRAGGVGDGACFARPMGGEIVVGGRKLVGSAQVRAHGVLLQHGSILLDDGQDVVARVTRGAARPPDAASLAGTLGRRVSFDEVADALTRATRNTWPGRWRTIEPPDAARFVAHFASAAWTWRR